MRPGSEVMVATRPDGARTAPASPASGGPILRPARWARARRRVLRHPTLAALVPSLLVAALVVREAAWRGLDGARHWSLFDDAMISMSYARTLAGTGELVWFAGAPRTEGVTNLGWTLVMAALHRLGLSGDAVVLAVIGLGLLAVWAAALQSRPLVVALAGRRDPGTRFVAVLAVATCFPLLWWSLRGMEVGVLVLLALLAVNLTRSVVNATGDPTRPALLLAATLVAGIIVRTDFALVPAVLVAWLLMGPRHDDRRRAAVLIGLVTGVALAATTMFRLAYYGDPVPNTYYLKLTGVALGDRVGRGVLVTGLATLAYLGPLLLVVVGGWRRLGDDARDTARLLALLAAATAGYGVYVGGDAWEYFLVPNRYLTPVLVLLVILAVGVAQARPTPRPGTGPDDHDGAAGRWRRLLAVALLWAGVGPALAYLAVERHPRPDLAVVAVPDRGAWFSVALPVALLAVIGAWRVSRPGPRHQRTPATRGVAVGVLLLCAAGAVAGPALALTGIDRAADYSRLGEQLGLVTAPGARVAVVAAGATQYVSERAEVDLLGKSDEHVAKAPPVGDGFLAPGHDKYDFEHSIGGLQPDVVAQVWRELDPVDLVRWGYRPYRLAGGELSDAASSTCDGHPVLWVRMVTRDRSRPLVHLDRLVAVDPGTCAGPAVP